ncbi:MULTISPECIES: dephospho-CoA kinase [unclassified Brevundimonas]|uniref:dephospho-CoA kinase n=1 Tax=unclassified Brevundimonas TaxID=2622653 RepID=UPI0025BCB162|nr:MULTISPECIES: dephospho-CoA kinase [unclassified Brevundimonas]
MIILGLTGGIGMGKSTTADFFREEGAVVWDADAAVHRLYAKGGEAVADIAKAFGPDVIVDGAVDRPRLAAVLGNDGAQFDRLNAIVHPLVLKDRMWAMGTAKEEGVRLFIVDIPLLFETGADAYVDATVVASAPAELQRERVLARPGMTPERLEAIVARQMPDAEKRARADFIVETGEGLEPARQRIRQIVATVLDPSWKSARAGLFSDQ